MAYQGPGKSGIHATQLSVTASLLSRGEPIESVVATVLAATRAAVGSLGTNWNWRREERAIRTMCETWSAKHPFEIRTDPEAHTPPPETGAEIKEKTARASEGEAE